MRYLFVQYLRGVRKLIRHKSFRYPISVFEKRNNRLLGYSVLVPMKRIILELAPSESPIMRIPSENRNLHLHLLMDRKVLVYKEQVWCQDNRQRGLMWFLRCSYAFKTSKPCIFMIATFDPSVCVELNLAHIAQNPSCGGAGLWTASSLGRRTRSNPTRVSNNVVVLVPHQATTHNKLPLTP